VVVSSVQCAAPNASNAVDGESGSPFYCFLGGPRGGMGSQFLDGQWITSISGPRKTAARVEAQLGERGQKGTKIQFERRHGEPGDNYPGPATPLGGADYTGPVCSGRYVRVSVRPPPHRFGYSRYGFSVYGTGTTAGVTPMERSAWTTSASSTRAAGRRPTYIDGRHSSRWSAEARGRRRPPGVVQIDLVSLQTLDRIAFDAGNSVNDYAGLPGAGSDNGTTASQPDRDRQRTGTNTINTPPQQTQNKNKNTKWR